MKWILFALVSFWLGWVAVSCARSAPSACCSGENVALYYEAPTITVVATRTPAQATLTRLAQSK
jgi:hypothetical protein